MYLYWTQQVCYGTGWRMKWGYEFGKLQVFAGVLTSIKGTFPNLPVSGVKHFACAADTQNTSYVVLIDNVTCDLWYFSTVGKQIGVTNR